MYRQLFVCAVIMTAALLSGCGKTDELGSVGGAPITLSEYLDVFNGLPAEEQVSVLEPGGRMALMERIIRKRLLLAAWQEDPSVSEKWEELYTVAALSDSMFRRIAVQFDPEAFEDSLEASGHSHYTITAVLLEDSLQAVERAEQWNTGNVDGSAPSVSAPWSSPGSSTSFKVFSGPLHMITPEFIPLLSMETGTAHLLPMYGEWCVAMIELQEGQWQEDDNALGTGLLNFVSLRSGETLLAPGIRELAASCGTVGTHVIPQGEGSSTPVALTGSDTLTVADMIRSMNMVSQGNFPGDIPGELLVFAPPELMMSVEITLWFHVSSVAQRYSLAEMAAGEGVQVPQGTLDYARAESVVRDRLIDAATPDSSAVAQWYSENQERFTLPERRSIILGYSHGEPPVPTPEGFDQIPDLQTVVDQHGEMAPTPAQVEESFGDVLGPEVFSAAEGVFTGPVMLDGELAAWFQVVEIVPPGVPPLEEVFPVVASTASGEMFAQGFETLIEELRSAYPVVVDTSTVVEIDLWGGMR